MKNELQTILSNVNDWLKFAEAKNAALIVFNSAAIAGILQAFSADDAAQLFLKGLMLFLFTIPVCICIYSFLPVMNKTFSYRKLEDAEFEVKKKELNCYFFKHHSKINGKQLLSLLHYKAATTNPAITDIETDIADQIINNAEIAVSKFELFTWAAYITAGGVVAGMVVLVIKVF